VALFAPAGTPATVTAKIQQDVSQVLSDGEVKEKLDAVAFEPFPISHADMRSLMQADFNRYGEVVKRAKISIE